MSSPEQLPEILKCSLDELEYLSGIQHKTKLFMSTKSYIPTEAWLNSSRGMKWYLSETLDVQLRYLEHIVKKGLECFEIYDESLHFMKLVKTFYSAYEGLKRFRETYKDEGRDIIQLNSLIYQMESKLDNLDSEVKKLANISF